MVDAFREMLEMVKHAPEYTMWVLLGILFYKVFIAGSWIMVARLLIIKLHDFFTREKTTKVSLDGMFISADGTYESFLRMLKEFREESNKSTKSDLRFLHFSDVQWLRSAMQEKFERERIEAKK